MVFKLWNKNPFFQRAVLSNAKAESRALEIIEGRDRQMQFVKKYGTATFVNEYASKCLSSLTAYANLGHRVPYRTSIEVQHSKLVLIAAQRP